MFISVCPHCHSQWINSLGKREFSLYCAALAEFKSLGSSVLPEVVKAREKNSCLVSEGTPCQLSCEIHTSKQDNLFHPDQISYPGMEIQIDPRTQLWPNSVIECDSIIM